MPLSVTTTNNKVHAFDEVKAAQGGEKVVFFSPNRDYVVCFFKAGLKDRKGRLHRLNQIVHGEYNITVGDKQEYWRNHFCWPIGVVDEQGCTGLTADFYTQNGIESPGLAVICPAYRDTFFFKSLPSGKMREAKSSWFTGTKAKKLVDPSYRGNIRSYLRICGCLARAVRKLHFKGLAHSDLSDKNVLIDTVNGEACIIDIDSLVVPNVAPPSVIGTPGYIAPEVLASQSGNSGKAALPCIQTDLHAMAVLIYEYLLHRHPLRGKRVISQDPTEDEVLKMGSMALFVESPTDSSNHLPRNPAIPYSRLGPHLAKLIERAFGAGLQDPSKRPTASQWEQAIYRTFDLLFPSSPSDWFFFGPGLPRTCPYTGKRIEGDVPIATCRRKRNNILEDEGYSITVHHHKYLFQWHIYQQELPGENADTTPVGYFVQDRNKWWLSNLSDIEFSVVDHNQQVVNAVTKGQAVEIRRGLVLKFPPKQGSRTSERYFAFDFI